MVLHPDEPPEEFRRQARQSGAWFVILATGLHLNPMTVGIEPQYLDPLRATEPVLGWNRLIVG
ncbi:MAG: hypothetical protein BECKG1743D_GA0114223_102772 [Candidatus Kentron sp. G]|nr:MAG: hypothetical protein BECKG1743E_GA0114224_102742 [Candidatus Kentron sp. G]VFN01408.1 MAG: hypothetical protein BECKG1743D_GA0114223_102772 [Candidatus Kentron sp. G]